MKLTYRNTIAACFTGSTVQSIVNNYVPLLFILFHTHYGIPLSSIALMVTANFLIQMTVDFIATFVADRIGYRRCIVTAQILSALGLVGLAWLPEIMPPFAGLMTATVIYAVGGGISEVLISPIMESCPTKNKEKAMSLLHSFYCWGHVAVVLVSTAFFAIFGMEIWQILACLWALVPAVNTVVFLKTPIATLNSPDDPGMSIGELLKTRLFWFMAVMMICGGASEQSVSQWASAFAEAGLGVSKAVGDLTGPLTFAILMGLSRLLYGKYGEKIPMEKFMLGSTALCLFAYLLTVFAPHPALSLVGCALCGFAVGIMWPGTLSQAAGAMRRGGTAMFALLALAGDIGCSAGPALVGFVSDAPGGSLKAGIFAAAIFPAVLLVCLLLRKKKR
jgi:MFS family permease